MSSQNDGDASSISGTNPKQHDQHDDDAKETITETTTAQQQQQQTTTATTERRTTTLTPPPPPTTSSSSSNSHQQAEQRPAYSKRSKNKDSKSRQQQQNHNNSNNTTNHNKSNNNSSEYVAFSHDDEDDPTEDFMMKFIDGSCRGYFPSDQNCQKMLPTCQSRIEEQLDIWTHCRQPMGFLSLFHHPHHDHNAANGSTAAAAAGGGSSNSNSTEVALPAGVYVVPTFCEYCGADHVQHCDPYHCSRPTLYFQKKRPPFCKPDATKWDPVTDHAIAMPSVNPPAAAAVQAHAVEQQQEDYDDEPAQSTSTRDAGTPVSFLSGLFGGAGHSDT